MNELNVVISFDENYVVPAIVALKSLYLASIPLIPNVLLLATGRGMNYKNIIEDSLSPAQVERLIFKEFRAEEWFRRSMLNGLQRHVSQATYGRVFIPELAPSHWSRCVYLDADILVCGIIYPLISHNTDAPLAAVRCPWTPYLASPRGIQQWEYLGYRPDDSYFNAGVLLFDLNIWRAQGLVSHCCDFFESLGDAMVQYDQELLNIALHGRIQELDQLWNVTSFWNEENDYIWSPVRSDVKSCDIRAKAKVIHFDGPQKPWQKLFPAWRLGARRYREILSEVVGLGTFSA